LPIANLPECGVKKQSAIGNWQLAMNSPRMLFTDVSR
jgi:hypothetical protein